MTSILSREEKNCIISFIASPLMKYTFFASVDIIKAIYMQKKMNICSKYSDICSKYSEYKIDVKTKSMSK